MIREDEIREIVMSMGPMLNRKDIEDAVKAVWDRDACDFWSGHSGEYVEPIVNLIEALLDKANVT